MADVYVKEGEGLYRCLDESEAQEGAEFFRERPADAYRIRYGLPSKKYRRPNHGAVQPDVQFYTPYRGKRTALTGTWEERESQIRALDAADCDHGRDEAESREILNLK